MGTEGMGQKDNLYNLYQATDLCFSFLQFRLYLALQLIFF